MSHKHVVQKGECVASIACEYGFFLETVWKHPENAELREQRENPYVLKEGDVVFIPDKKIREEPRPTGKQHRFRVRNVPEKFRLQLLDEGEPRTGLTYKLEIDKLVFDGTTDADGWIDHWIPPESERGRLTLSDEEIYDIELGCLEPVEYERGVIERLRNLGFLVPDNEEDDPIFLALLAFQQTYELEPTGEIDDETRARLIEIHGS